jgi:hypothetical protein
MWMAGIEASCHCGTVRIDVAEQPEELTSCNCSICRRIGALWAYYRPEQIVFVAGRGATVGYVQGERTLAMHHCPTCGCVTHYESVTTDYKDRIAINARLMDPAATADARVRRFDGASTWQYLD